MKFLKWFAAILVTLIGFGEVILKFLKELVTLIIDILFPIIPIEKFKVIVNNVRAWIDVAYDWLSKNKEQMLKFLNLLI